MFFCGNKGRRFTGQVCVAMQPNELPSESYFSCGRAYIPASENKIKRIRVGREEETRICKASTHLHANILYFPGEKFVAKTPGTWWCLRFFRLLSITVTFLVTCARKAKVPLARFPGNVSARRQQRRGLPRKGGCVRGRNSTGRDYRSSPSVYSTLRVANVGDVRKRFA